MTAHLKSDTPHHLTPTEHRILTLIAAGHTNTEIATATYRGLDGVKSHIHHLHTKLGARNRAHIIAIAYQNGLLNPADTTYERITSASDIGPTLRRLRLEQAVTQRDVAEAAQVDEPNLCAYELGRRTPDPDTTIRILTALGHEFAIVRKERRITSEEAD